MFFFPFFIFQHHKQDSQGVDLLYNTRRISPQYIANTANKFWLMWKINQIIDSKQNEPYRTDPHRTEQNRADQGHAPLSALFPYIENIIFSCKTAKHSWKVGAAA